MPLAPITFQETPRFEANPVDLFITPQSVADYTCKAIKELTGVTGDYRMLDPGCGTGVWGKSMNKVFNYPMTWGIDIENRLGYNEDLINPEPYDFYIVQDFLTWDSGQRHFDAVIGNPPYSARGNRNLAEDFLIKSLRLTRPGGIVGLLLKTEYIASLRRYENIYKNIRPKYMIQYVPRIKWEGFQFNNTIEYAFFIWEKGCTDRTQLYWLNWKTGKLI